MFFLLFPKFLTCCRGPCFILKAGDYSVVIYDKGCLRAGEEWVERNLIPVAGVAVAMAVLQVNLLPPKNNFICLFDFLFCLGEFF